MNYVISEVELIGKAKDSGFNKPYFLIKTRGKKYIQLTELLFQIVAAMVNCNDLQIVAKIVSEKNQKILSKQQIEYLIEQKLIPLGIVYSTDNKSNTTVETQKSLLGLNLSNTLLSEKIVKNIANFLSPFFILPIVLIIILVLAFFEFWLFHIHGLQLAINQTVNQPILLILDFILLILSSIFHEFGHAAACKYGGGKPGRIGYGIYIIWPAFFTDLTDVYRLNRIDRIRSDLGGIYFNLIFSLIIAGLYLFTHFEPLLIIIVFQNLEVLNQLLPFMRLDGYFVAADIAGIPDLFTRIKPILKNIIPGQNIEAVKDLKPWTKRIVVLWVAITVPLLSFYIILMLINVPQLLSSVKASIISQAIIIDSFFNNSNYLMAFFEWLQLLILLFTILGIFVITYRILETVYHLIIPIIIKTDKNNRKRYTTQLAPSQQVIFQTSKYV